jgi:hypothetical protein
LNIYIYGNHSFKKEIHETLEHSNIKFKLDDNSLIKDIDTLYDLKRTIQNNPKDIYLIDDEKIIKKNSLNKKIKFLTPKDGIEEEFLLDSGISDLSINSLSEIPKYILRKHEEEKQSNSNIQNSIIDIVDEAYEKENSLDLDDELAQLLAKEETSSNEEIKNESSSDENLEDLFDMSKDINFGDAEDISKNEFDDIMNFNDDFGLNNISFDYDDKAVGKDIQDNLDLSDLELSNDTEDDDDDSIFEDLDFLEEMFSGEIKEKIEDEKLIEDEYEDDNEVFEDLDFLEEIFSKEKKEVKKSIESINSNESLPEDNNMDSNEFFELDSLNEKDLLEALNCVDNNKSDKKPVVNVKNNLVEKDSSSINISSGSSVEELAQLISKLLNNKTLEITIKIKD